jgi:PAS domain S-box-containing protein
VIRILLLDDEPAILDITSAFLNRQEGFRVRTIDSVKGALMLLSEYPFDVIVADYELPDQDGISFLKQVRSSHSSIPFIFFTGRVSEDIAIDALNEGADFYLKKGDGSVQVLTKLAGYIQKAVDKRRKRDEIILNEHRYRELAEQQMEYAQYIQALLDAIPAPVFFRDTNGVYRDCNKAFEDLIGHRKYSIIGRSVHDFYPKDLADHYRHMDELIIKNPYIQQYEYVITDSQGEIHDVLFSKSALLSHEGSVTGIIGVILDVSERKKLERIIIENEEKYRTLADFTYDWESWISPTGTYIYTSPSCERITGYRAEEFLHNPGLVLEITHPDDRQMVERHYSNAPLRHDGIHHMDYRIITKDGQERWISHFCQSVFRDDGTWLGRRESKRDITFRKEVTAAYEKANMKLHLLSSITRHDILNQLTVLSGYTDLLSDYADNPDIHAILNRMNRTIDTINNQISFTRLYQEIGVNAPQWHHVPTLVRQAGKGSHIPSIEVSEDLSDIHILADPLMEKVFYCLLDNSERHGKRVSRAHFYCYRTDGDMTLVYEDDGYGITAGIKEKIFERGFGSNTGYGLFLAREILNISGFSIFETGESGEGARFQISIPKGLWRHEPQDHMI